MKINVSKEDAPVVSRDYIRKGYVYKHSNTGSKYYLAVGALDKAVYLVNLETGGYSPLSSCAFDGWVEVEAEVIIK